MCLFPKLVKNPKYRVNKKNGGQVPPMKDPRVAYVPIGCGYCFECKKQKANEWRIRLMEEIKTQKHAKFITLTFSSEAFEYISSQVKEKSGYALDNAVATYGVRHFLERWRRRYKKSVKHWLITELGGKGTENVHLHGIIFTDSAAEVERIWNNGKIPYGFVWTGKKKGSGKINYVTDRTINYMVKYVTKTDIIHPAYKPKILCSKGIGAGYRKSLTFKKHKYDKDGETDEIYRTKRGLKLALPIYYRNSAFTEEEREKLWIEKLDKGIRWIGGDKVDANDEESIRELLIYHQRRNAEMGYGSPKTWAAREYEEERRKVMHAKRIQKLREKEAKNTEAKCYHKKGTTSSETNNIAQNGLNKLTEIGRKNRDEIIDFE